MIDLATEELLDPAAAARHPAFRNFKTNKPAHVAAVYRAMQHGSRAVNGERVRLEFVKVPGGLRTSNEAIARFVARLTDPTDHDGQVVSLPERRQQIENARKTLAAAGIA